jgi:hypothetical protein
LQETPPSIVAVQLLLPHLPDLVIIQLAQYHLSLAVNVHLTIELATGMVIAIDIVDNSGIAQGHMQPGTTGELPCKVMVADVTVGTAQVVLGNGFPCPSLLVVITCSRDRLR